MNISISPYFNVLMKSKINGIAVQAILWNIVKKVNGFDRIFDCTSVYWTINKKKYGPYKKWNEDGQIYEDYYYIKDVKEDLYRRWHDSGKIQEESFYSKGNLHGPSKHWNVNGQIEEECFYDNGKRIGPYYKQYGYNGNIMKEIIYSGKNKKIKSILYRKNGSMQKIIVYCDRKGNLLN